MRAEQAVVEMQNRGPSNDGYGNLPPSDGFEAEPGAAFKNGRERPERRLGFECGPA